MFSRFRLPCTQYDIGILANMNNVTDEVKYNLLTKQFKPDSNHIFPVKLLHGSDTCLNFHWLIEYPFLVYSKINDSVCCLPCILFGENNKNKLAKLPGFSKWHKVVINVKIMSIIVPIRLQLPQQVVSRKDLRNHLQH